MRSSFKRDVRGDKLGTQEFGGDETAHERVMVARAEEGERSLGPNIYSVLAPTAIKFRDY